MIDLNTLRECGSLKVRWSVERAGKGSGCRGSGGVKSVVVVVVVRTGSGRVRSASVVRVERRQNIRRKAKVEVEDNVETEDGSRESKVEVGSRRGMSQVERSLSESRRRSDRGRDGRKDSD